MLWQWASAEFMSWPLLILQKILLPIHKEVISMGWLL
jgi:hypothetical protein